MRRSSESGTAAETYVTTLQHDIISFEGYSGMVSVGRQPTGWFHAAVGENRPAPGPPEALLEATKQRHEDLTVQGCEFSDRCREHTR